MLTFRMRELGRGLDLDDVTEDLVPAMPNHHTHTVGQLVSNRGCVRHYQEGLDTGMVDERLGHRTGRGRGVLGRLAVVRPGDPATTTTTAPTATRCSVPRSRQPAATT